MGSALAPESGIRIRVPAKINLALCVGPIGDDGYHPLTTVFQAVSLFDEVSAEWDRPGEFSVQTVGEDADAVPDDDSNLAIRAARLLADRYLERDSVGVQLSIRKSIPVAGGMAGGSADAAAAMLACSVLWDIDADLDQLRELAAEVGADVPFGLMGGTAIGTRRGDRLVPALSRGTFHWVLAVADAGLSTPSVFRRFDQLHPQGCSTEMPTDVLNALTSGDAVALGKTLRNDLAEAAVDLRPQLGQTLEAGLEAGALGAMVSGSGPTCAFLARNEDAAVALSVRLASDGVARAIRRVRGPVPGARLVN